MRALCPFRYDYWCMPQRTPGGEDDRTPAQKDRFDWMLKNMDLLYIGASVLLLVDLSYISRFWTQFEAWLSMQVCTPDGIRGAGSLYDDQHPRRCVIVPTLNASAAVADEVRQMWSERTPQEAHDVLVLPDVTVTNQKDKTFFLPRLLDMDTKVKNYFATQISTEGEEGLMDADVEKLAT